MIEIVKAGARHLSDFGWLKTYWLFCKRVAGDLLT